MQNVNEAIVNTNNLAKMSIKNNPNQSRLAPVDLNENQSESKKSAARARLRLAIPKMQQADIQQQQQQKLYQQQMIQSENENSDYMVRLTSDDSCSSGSGSGIENSRYFNLQDGNRFMFIDEENDFGNELSNRDHSPIITQVMDIHTSPISPQRNPTQKKLARLMSLSPTFHYNMENVST
ncbi:hypothetical protein Bhyg_09486 [Pseudolycoriella hygida]|uniref:Uncharacterized protein n=1 Tax=Pseudolycoriella hygida TaxID=35572 RepID=A0A9Q0S401_9DIPT|nr:hypothetical protein Bhyg_09486 [Pseudolycoriella hygida]